MIQEVKDDNHCSFIDSDTYQLMVCPTCSKNGNIVAYKTSPWSQVFCADCGYQIYVYSTFVDFDEDWMLQSVKCWNDCIKKQLLESL